MYFNSKIESKLFV